jgi:hypothetical protein
MLDFAVSGYGPREVVRVREQGEVGSALRVRVAHRESVLRLGAVYEQLNAPFGAFGQSIAKASTEALASGSASDDSTYTSIEGSISSLTAKRDTLAASIRDALNGAAFAGKALSEQQAKGWIGQAQGLIDQAAKLASSQ